MRIFEIRTLSRKKQFESFQDALDWIIKESDDSIFKISIVEIDEEEGWHDVKNLGKYVKQGKDGGVPSREKWKRNSGAIGSDAGEKKEDSEEKGNDNDSVENPGGKRGNRGKKSKNLDVRTRLSAGTPVIVEKIWEYGGHKYVKVTVGERPRYYRLYKQGYKMVKFRDGKELDDEDMPYDEEVYDIVLEAIGCRARG